jgi:nicotinamidase-related amidase
LVVVDMQYFDAHRDYGLARRASPGELDEYFEQVDAIVPRIRRLQDCAREIGLTLVHVRLCSHAANGADRSRTHRLRDWRYDRGTKEAEFLEEVAPAPGEPVVDKTTSGAFNSGRLEHVLRAGGIERIVVCGVDTRFCVETTVRDASDRGFEVVLVADGCASKSRALHEQGVELLRDSYCVVMDTDEVVANVRASSRIASSADHAETSVAHDEVAGHVT